MSLSTATLEQLTALSHTVTRLALKLQQARQGSDVIPLTDDKRIPILQRCTEVIQEFDDMGLLDKEYGLEPGDVIVNKNNPVPIRDLHGLTYGRLAGPDDAPEVALDVGVHIGDATGKVLVAGVTGAGLAYCQTERASPDSQGVVRTPGIWALVRDTWQVQGTDGKTYILNIASSNVTVTPKP